MPGRLRRGRDGARHDRSCGGGRSIEVQAGLELASRGVGMLMVVAWWWSCCWLFSGSIRDRHWSVRCGRAALHTMILAAAAISEAKSVTQLKRKTHPNRINPGQFEASFDRRTSISTRPFVQGPVDGGSGGSMWFSTWVDPCPNALRARRLEGRPHARFAQKAAMRKHASAFAGPEASQSRWAPFRVGPRIRTLSSPHMLQQAPNRSNGRRAFRGRRVGPQ